MDNEKSIVLFWNLFKWLNHICFFGNYTLILDSTCLALFSNIQFFQCSSLLLTIKARHSLVWFGLVFLWFSLEFGFLFFVFFCLLKCSKSILVCMKDRFPCKGVLLAGTLAVGLPTDFFWKHGCLALDKIYLCV